MAAEFDEKGFQRAYGRLSKSLGLATDPDDPRHFYDWRTAYAEGRMVPGESGHFDSRYKKLGHPNLIVQGVDTRTGQPATPELIRANTAANLFQNLIRRKG